MPIPTSCSCVLLNLARNAAQALEGLAAQEGGDRQIRIAAKREGIVTIIEVSDSGSACRRKRASICSRRSRVPPAPAEPDFGLTIAAELVRAHGGHIRLVDSNIGATFRIEILRTGRWNCTPRAAAPALKFIS